MGTTKQTTKQKGDILEDVIEKFCRGITNAQVKKRHFMTGKSGTRREVDVLINGKYGFFDISIALEAKNYKASVGIEKIDGFIAKIADLGIQVGAMVCPSGFTKDAQKRAENDGLILFETVDQTLGNSKLFIPLRYIQPKIQAYSFALKHRSPVPFNITQDVSAWRFHIGEKLLKPAELLATAWNDGRIPQRKGTHIINFNAVAISEAGKSQFIQYFELSADVVVGEDFFLMLQPASFLRRIHDNQFHFNLKVGIFSSEGDMIKFGWKKFGSLEEMNAAADIENQPQEVRDLILRPEYTVEVNGEPAITSTGDSVIKGLETT